MASEAEIQRALQQQNVIDNQGTLTILPFQQIVEIYEQLIPLIVRQDWSLQHLSEVQLTQHLQCSRPIVHFVLSKLSSSFTTSDDDDVIWSLSSESVTTCLLHVLFLRASVSGVYFFLLLCCDSVLIVGATMCMVFGFDRLYHGVISPVNWLRDIRIRSISRRWLLLLSCQVLRLKVLVVVVAVAAAVWLRAI